MRNTVPSYRFVKNSDSENPFPLNNPPSPVVVDVSKSQDLKDFKIEKTTTTTKEQQEQIEPCELSSDEWECDWGDEVELSSSELFEHIRTPEHIKGMIELLAKMGVEGSAQHRLPTTYPHQTDHTICHIKNGMSDENKEGIRNWGGFIRWYIEHTATETRPTFSETNMPFRPKSATERYFGRNRY
jgi:hypothetical protein